MLGSIELTEHEATLAARVKEADRLLLHEHNVERTRSAGIASRELMELLLKRKAIPEARLRHFTDERYNGSNPRSSRIGHALFAAFHISQGLHGEVRRHSHLNLLQVSVRPQFPKNEADRLFKRGSVRLWGFCHFPNSCS
jgi:hypothetical protein